MNCEYTTTCNDSVFQMIPPLFHPLRLWTPRAVPDCAPVRRLGGDEQPPQAPLRAFTVIRGRLVHMSGGERRMVIAGTIFKRREV